MSDTQRGYSAKQVADFERELAQLRNKTAGLQIVLHELLSFLTNPRARTFASEGIGRRIAVVARCAQNIFALYPPSTAALLSADECTDVAIQMQTFAINVYAIFDNIAWVCMLEAGGMLPPLKVSLFKKECMPFIPKDLLSYLSQDVSKKWFEEYGKLYRDSTAHRIPPYLPTRVYTPEEAEKFRDLHSQSQQAVLKASGAMLTDRRRMHQLLDQRLELDQQKNALGSNSILLALSLTGVDAVAPVYLHPQVLCDWGLANEVLETFDRSIRTHYGWPIRQVPRVQVS